MNAALRGVLIGLVLVDLLFVKITEAARPEWLYPLFALAALNPLLLRLRRRLAYRLAWNGAILSVFALLVHHATSGGVRYLLEDGLLLAALCQVHLLNNIGPDQKPDLLFFNSFLIPVVTCFLSGALAYLVLFLLYAPLLVLGLMLYARVREGSPPAALGAVVGDAALRSAVVVAITLLLFTTVPRDFHRKGLVGDHLRFQPVGILNPGFTDEVDLERSGLRGGNGDPVVMRIHVERGTAAAVPAYWRGGTLTWFTGSEWTPGAHSFVGGARRPAPGGARVRVELLDTRYGRLFAPLAAARIDIPDPWLAPRLTRLRSGALLLPGIEDRRSGFTYTVTMRAEPPRPGGRRDWPERLPELQLPEGRIPEVLVAKAAELRESLGPGAPQHQVVERIRAWLERAYEYLPPGEPGAAGSLAEFASGRAGGHCEFFATALAMMLRSQGIPARFAAGYRSAEWDEEGRILTVRERHAHAWVEVLDPRAGWTTVDATPPALFETARGEGPLAAVGAALSRAWEFLKGFDGKARRRALAWLAALPGRLGRTAEDHPWAMGLVAALLAVLLLRRRARRALPPPVRNYLRAVRRAGLQRDMGETPRELLRRAKLLALPPKRLRALEQATSRHEAARYRRSVRP